MAEPESVTTIDLNAEIARFPPHVPSGRRAETLLKTPHLRVVLVTMQAGAELHDHAAPGPITVQPLQGKFTLLVEGEERAIAKGALAAVESGARHAVRAIDDGAFLLTIAWPGNGGSGDGR